MSHLFDSIKQTVFARLNHYSGDIDNELPEESSQTAAVTCRAESKALHPGRRRLKENYTSHWDLDYLPREEMDQLIEKSKDKSAINPD